MLNPIKLCIAFCLAAFLSACGKPPEETMLSDTGEHAILPLHERFLSESLQLAQQTEPFCSASVRTDKDLAALRSRWLAAMNAWEGIQSIQFGPVNENNQAWKVQFWPDRKNLIARKTEQFVQRDDAITLPALQDASVVIQGLSAMEYLLYDSPAESLLGETPSHYCEHLVAVALNLNQVADFLYQQWHPSGGDFLGKWTHPGPDNLDFPDQQAAIGAVIESLVYGLERIKRDKLERPLGLTEGGQANVYLLEWWRSQQSREAILINLHSLQMLYTADGHSGLAALLVEHDAAELSERVTETFDRAISYTASIEGSLFESHAASDEAIRQLYDSLTELLGAFKREIPTTLGISLGFNANDGD